MISYLIVGLISIAVFVALSMAIVYAIGRFIDGKEQD